MAQFPSGYTFPVLNSDGTFSTTREDFADVFVRKELFLNSGLWSVGFNFKGELGLGDVVHRSSPVQVGLLTNWKQVSCGSYHTVAIDFAEIT